MFGSNLKKRIKTECIADGFEGCSAGIRRLGKKIGSRKVLVFCEKMGKFPTSYLFTKSTNPCQTIPKNIRKASSFNPHFQIAPKHQRQ
jgi:hypothetical protein